MRCIDVGCCYQNSIAVGILSVRLGSVDSSREAVSIDCSSAVYGKRYVSVVEKLDINRLTVKESGVGSGCYLFSVVCGSTVEVCNCGKIGCLIAGRKEISAPCAEILIGYGCCDRTAVSLVEVSHAVVVEIYVHVGVGAELNTLEVRGCSCVSPGNVLMTCIGHNLAGRLVYTVNKRVEAVVVDVEYYGKVYHLVGGIGEQRGKGNVSTPQARAATYGRGCSYVSLEEEGVGLGACSSNVNVHYEVLALTAYCMQRYNAAVPEVKELVCCGACAASAVRRLVVDRISGEQGIYNRGDTETGVCSVVCVAHVGNLADVAEKVAGIAIHNCLAERCVACESSLTLVLEEGNRYLPDLAVYLNGTCGIGLENVVVAVGVNGSVSENGCGKYGLTKELNLDLLVGYESLGECSRCCISYAVNGSESGKSLVRTAFNAVCPTFKRTCSNIGLNVTCRSVRSIALYVYVINEGRVVFVKRNVSAHVDTKAGGCIVACSDVIGNRETCIVLVRVCHTVLACVSAVNEYVLLVCAEVNYKGDVRPCVRGLNVVLERYTVTVGITLGASVNHVKSEVVDSLCERSNVKVENDDGALGNAYRVVSDVHIGVYGRLINSGLDHIEDVVVILCSYRVDIEGALILLVGAANGVARSLILKVGELGRVCTVAYLYGIDVGDVRSRGIYVLALGLSDFYTLTKSEEKGAVHTVGVNLCVSKNNDGLRGSADELYFKLLVGTESLFESSSIVVLNAVNACDGRELDLVSLLISSACGISAPACDIAVSYCSAKRRVAVTEESEGHIIDTEGLALSNVGNEVVSTEVYSYGLSGKSGCTVKLTCVVRRGCGYKLTVCIDVSLISGNVAYNGEVYPLVMGIYVVDELS